MSKRNVVAVALIVLVTVLVAGPTPAAASEPGLGHTFMAGSVIESSPEGVYICLGSPDGAAVGQQFDVVRVTRDRSGNPKQGARFKRTKVGTVRIDAIVDEHFAEATVTSGSVEKGDIVRLSEPADGAKE